MANLPLSFNMWPKICYLEFEGSEWGVDDGLLVGVSNCILENISIPLVCVCVFFSIQP